MLEPADSDISAQLDDVSLDDSPAPPATSDDSTTTSSSDLAASLDDPQQVPTPPVASQEESESLDDGDLGAPTPTEEPVIPESLDEPVDHDDASRDDEAAPPSTTLAATSPVQEEEGEGFEAVSLEQEQPEQASGSQDMSSQNSEDQPPSSAASDHSTSTSPTTVADLSSSKVALPATEDDLPLPSPSFKGTVSTATESIVVSNQEDTNIADGPSATEGGEEEAAAAVASTSTTEESIAAKVEVPKQPKVATNAPSIMQKVVSMTRQRDLPPKSKDEEKKHLRELEEMRTASKEAEKRRKSQSESAAQARSASLAAAFPAWEKGILPNWRSVLREDANGKALRKIWWEGTMPVRWRGRLWSLVIGNSLSLAKHSFAGHLARAKKMLSEGTYGKDVLEALEKDVEQTLPTLKLFQSGGVMHEDLVDLLLAYTVYASETPRYSQGLSCPAAMLLINMPPSDAFVSLTNLISKSFLRSFYSENQNELEAYYRVFDTLLADTMPKIYENFSKEVVRPSLYLFPWLTTLYVRFLPLDLATRLFDVFILEGDSMLFRVALVLLEILEPRLFNPVQSELDAVFKGEDKGAVALVRRDRSHETEGDEVLVEEVYGEMGCTEDKIFGLLRAMEWKEETWERLVGRELPEAD